VRSRAQLSDLTTTNHQLDKNFILIKNYILSGCRESRENCHELSINCRTRDFVVLLFMYYFICIGCSMNQIMSYKYDNLVRMILLVINVFLLSNCSVINFQRSLTDDEVKNITISENMAVLNLQNVDEIFTVVLFERNIVDWGKEVGCYVMSRNDERIDTYKLTTLAHKEDELNAYKSITILSGMVHEYQLTCVSVNDITLKVKSSRIEFICNDGITSKTYTFLMDNGKTGFIFADRSLRCSEIRLYNDGQQEIFREAIPTISGR
jgi:hypothetical protein